MDIGMTLPSMVDGNDRTTMRRWCHAIDEGPFSSLAVGERITYRNLEMFSLLSAAAAWTERVRLIATLVVLPMHPAAVAAKQLATLDVLSEGRLIAGLGVGGREADYQAAERSFARRHQRLDDQVAEMRRAWAGERLAEGFEPIGPAPYQDGGPPLWAGAMGPKAIRRAAEWADAIAGFMFAPTREEVTAAIDSADAAWADAGRADPPRRVTSFWYALGPDAQPRLESYARHYLAVFGDDIAEAMASTCSVAGDDALGRALDEMEAAGVDEVLLVPTTNSVAELARTADLVARR